MGNWRESSAEKESKISCWDFGAWASTLLIREKVVGIHTNWLAHLSNDTSILAIFIRPVCFTITYWTRILYSRCVSSGKVDGKWWKWRKRLHHLKLFHYLISSFFFFLLFLPPHPTHTLFFLFVLLRETHLLPFPVSIVQMHSDIIKRLPFISLPSFRVPLLMMFYDRTTVAIIGPGFFFHIRLYVLFFFPHSHREYKTDHFIRSSLCRFHSRWVQYKNK